MHTGVERLRDRADDEGASLIEYAGLLALIGAIVAAVVKLQFPQTIIGNVSKAIRAIFSGAGN
jgi:Flp pilus assembly pilin Flp